MKLDPDLVAEEFDSSIVHFLCAITVIIIITLIIIIIIISVCVPVLKEFKELLRKQATVEAFIEWLDLNVEQKIIKVKLIFRNTQLFRGWEGRRHTLSFVEKNSNSP